MQHLSHTHPQHPAPAVSLANALALQQEYAILQEKYLSNVHLPSYYAARDAWHRSLYQPLQRFVATVMAQSCPRRPLHLCYIGPGPYAPLFTEPHFREAVLARLNRITLVDICSSALARCQRLLHDCAPHLIIHCVRLDVTSGMGHAFLGLLQQIAQQGQIPPSPLQACMPPTSPRALPPIAADLVYSEMIATATTTAPIFAFELALASLADDDRTELLHAACSLWQEYNELSYRHQLTQYAALTAPDGTIAIAADTAKIFYDTTQPSITSFRTAHFPDIALPQLLKSPGRCEEQIVWMDHPEERVDNQYNVKALQPHCHPVGTEVYQRV